MNDKTKQGTTPKNKQETSPKTKQSTTPKNKRSTTPKVTALRKVTPFACAVLSFFIGWAWYSPFLFGRFWQEATIEKPASSDNMLVPMAVHFVLLNIIAYGMRMLFNKVKTINSLKTGAYFGLKLALCFVVTSLGTVYVYSGNPAFLTLWAIDAGYQTLIITVMGAILSKT